MPAHPTLVLRRTVYKKFGLFNESYSIAGDFEFISRIFYVNKIKYKYIKKTFVEMKDGGVACRIGGKITIMREIVRACYESGIKTNILYLIYGFMIKKRD